MIELCLVNANNYLKIPERRFLNATLVYFKMHIANVRYCNLPWRRSDENDQVRHHGRFSLSLSSYVPYLCMYVKVTASEFAAVGLTRIARYAKRPHGLQAREVDTLFRIRNPPRQ